MNDLTQTTRCLEISRKRRLEESDSLADGMNELSKLLYKRVKLDGVPSVESQYLKEEKAEEEEEENFNSSKPIFEEKTRKANYLKYSRDCVTQNSPQSSSQKLCIHKKICDPFLNINSDLEYLYLINQTGSYLNNFPLPIGTIIRSTGWIIIDGFAQTQFEIIGMEGYSNKGLTLKRGIFKPNQEGYPMLEIFADIIKTCPICKKWFV